MGKKYFYSDSGADLYRDAAADLQNGKVYQIYFFSGHYGDDSVASADFAGIRAAQEKYI